MWVSEAVLALVCGCVLACTTCRYLKLKFSEIPQAKSCIDELQNFREGVTVKHFTKEDSEST